MSIITNVRTIRLEQFPNSIWVEIETDENLTGLGPSGAPFLSGAPFPSLFSFCPS